MADPVTKPVHSIDDLPTFLGEVMENYDYGLVGDTGHSNNLAFYRVFANRKVFDVLKAKGVKHLCFETIDERQRSYDSYTNPKNRFNERDCRDFLRSEYKQFLGWVQDYEKDEQIDLKVEVIKLCREYGIRLHCVDKDSQLSPDAIEFFQFITEFGGVVFQEVLPYKDPERYQKLAKGKQELDKARKIVDIKVAKHMASLTDWDGNQGGKVFGFFGDGHFNRAASDIPEKLADGTLHPGYKKGDLNELVQLATGKKVAYLRWQTEYRPDYKNMPPGIYRGGDTSDGIKDQFNQHDVPLYTINTGSMSLQTAKRLLHDVQQELSGDLNALPPEALLHKITQTLDRGLAVSSRSYERREVRSVLGDKVYGSLMETDLIRVNLALFAAQKELAHGATANVAEVKVHLKEAGAIFAEVKKHQEKIAKEDPAAKEEGPLFAVLKFLTQKTETGVEALEKQHFFKPVSTVVEAAELRREESGRINEPIAGFFTKLARRYDNIIIGDTSHREVEISGLLADHHAFGPMAGAEVQHYCLEAERKNQSKLDAYIKGDKQEYLLALDKSSGWAKEGEKWAFLSATTRSLDSAHKAGMSIHHIDERKSRTDFDIRDPKVVQEMREESKQVNKKWADFANAIKGKKVFEVGYGHLHDETAFQKYLQGKSAVVAVHVVQHTPTEIYAENQVKEAFDRKKDGALAPDYRLFITDEMALKKTKAELAALQEQMKKKKPLDITGYQYSAFRQFDSDTIDLINSIRHEEHIKGFGKEKQWEAILQPFQQRDRRFYQVEDAIFRSSSWSLKDYDKSVETYDSALQNISQEIRDHQFTGYELIEKRLQVLKQASETAKEQAVAAILTTADWKRAPEGQFCVRFTGGKKDHNLACAESLNDALGRVGVASDIVFDNDHAILQLKDAADYQNRIAPKIKLGRQAIAERLLKEHAWQTTSDKGIVAFSYEIPKERRDWSDVHQIQHRAKELSERINYLGITEHKVVYAEDSCKYIIYMPHMDFANMGGKNPPVNLVLAEEIHTAEQKTESNRKKLMEIVKTGNDAIRMSDRITRAEYRNMIPPEMLRCADSELAACHAVGTKAHEKAYYYIYPKEVEVPHVEYVSGLKINTFREDSRYKLEDIREKDGKALPLALSDDERKKYQDLAQRLSASFGLEVTLAEKADADKLPYFVLPTRHEAHAQLLMTRLLHARADAGLEREQLPLALKDGALVLNAALMEKYEKEKDTGTVFDELAKAENKARWQQALKEAAVIYPSPVKTPGKSQRENPADKPIVQPDADVKRKEAEAKAKAEVEARQKAEEQAKAAAEEAKKKAEEERAKAETEAKRKAEEEKAKAKEAEKKVQPKPNALPAPVVPIKSSVDAQGGGLTIGKGLGAAVLGGLGLWVLSSFGAIAAALGAVIMAVIGWVAGGAVERSFAANESRRSSLSAANSTEARKNSGTAAKLEVDGMNKEAQGNKGDRLSAADKVRKDAQGILGTAIVMDTIHFPDGVVPAGAAVAPAPAKPKDEYGIASV